MRVQHSGWSLVEGWRAGGVGGAMADRRMEDDWRWRGWWVGRGIWILEGWVVNRALLCVEESVQSDITSWTVILRPPSIKSLTEWHPTVLQESSSSHCHWWNSLILKTCSAYVRRKCIFQSITLFFLICHTSSDIQFLWLILGSYVASHAAPCREVKLRGQAAGKQNCPGHTRHFSVVPDSNCHFHQAWGWGILECLICSITVETQVLFTDHKEKEYTLISCLVLKKRHRMGLLHPQNRFLERNPLYKFEEKSQKQCPPSGFNVDPLSKTYGSF